MPNTEQGSARWWNGQPSLALYNEFERDASGNIIDPRAYLGLYIPGGCNFLGKKGSWVPYQICSLVVHLMNGEENGSDVVSIVLTR